MKVWSHQRPIPHKEKMMDIVSWLEMVLVPQPDGSDTDRAGCSDMSGAGALVVEKAGHVDRGGGVNGEGVLVDDGSRRFENRVSHNDGGEGVKAAALKGE